MKKTEFYTMIRDRKTQEIHAALVRGYTDGTFWYYRDKERKEWFAVHPMVGLSVARGNTLQEAASRAYEPDRLKYINEEIDKRGAVLSANYAVAVAEAQEVR
jgi:hypothetical protein